MPNQELKPCPFCGSYDISLDCNSDNDPFTWCVNCGARTVECMTETEAIEAWNKRVEDGK